MTTSVSDTRISKAVSLVISDAALALCLADGRTISIPLSWYPRLVHATPAERDDWRLVGDDEGIHWPSVEEDISIESLLAGKRSQERPSSFQRWLSERKSRNLANK